MYIREFAWVCVGHVYDIVYIAVGGSLSFLGLGCCLISTSSRFLCSCSCALIVAGTLMLDADSGRQPDALCSRSGDSDSLRDRLTSPVTAVSSCSSCILFAVCSTDLAF